MKLVTSLILSLFIAVNVFSGEQTWPPIGRLGIQLGTVVEIKGIIVDGDALNVKSLQSTYLIEVHEINDAAVTNKLLMRFNFSPGFTLLKYPNNWQSLVELKTGKKSGWINSDDVKKLQVGYVGKQVHFSTWETGMFDGIPKNLPEGTPLWSAGNFSFRSWLVLLNDLSETNSNHH